ALDQAGGRVGRYDAAGRGGQPDAAAVAVQGAPRAGVIQHNLPRPARGLLDDDGGPSAGGRPGGAEGDVARLAVVTEGERSGGGGADVGQLGTAEVDAVNRVGGVAHEH